MDANSTLIPITPRAGWEGYPFLDILADRLQRLEHYLAGHGFAKPIPLINFHLKTLAKLREKQSVESDQILWALVEAEGLSNIYCCMPMMSEATLREKFNAIFAGPTISNIETVASNHARNTLFELQLAGWLTRKGIPATIGQNPDVSCDVADRRVFIQCKRPFSAGSIAKNINRACKQLSVDLNSAADARNRGVVAISMSKAINPDNKTFRVRTESDLALALSSEMRHLTDYYSQRLIKGPRIVGIVFQLTTAAFVESANEYRCADLLEVRPSKESSEADKRLIRHIFERKESGRPVSSTKL